MKPKITALMPQESRQSLLLVLEECGIDPVPASDRAEASYPLQAVLTDTVLPDGDWCGVLADVADSDTNTEVLVCARCADAMLWCDALERGAYDLLVEPYDRQEVRRIVEAAARSSMRSPAPGRESHSRIPVSHRADAA